MTNPWIQGAYRALGFSSHRAFVLFLVTSLILVILLSTAFRAMTDWLTLQFVIDERGRMSGELMAWFVRRPHEWFVQRNSAQLVRDLTHELSVVIECCMLKLCEMFRGTVLVLIICLGLFTMDVQVALVSSLIVGGAYALIYRKVDFRLARQGEERLVRMNRVYKTAAESLCTIKEARIPGRFCSYPEEFNESVRSLDETFVSHKLLASIPGHLTELTARIGILVVALYLILTGAENAFAMLSLYVVAIVRVAPEAQGIYSDLIGLKFYKPSLDRIHGYLHPGNPANDLGDMAKIRLDRSIRLEAVDFSYEGHDMPVIRNASLEIPVRTSLAIVGETGAGKTTLADILGGILVPRSGSVRVDDLVLDERSRSGWRNNIGYVPQEIYLVDDSVRKNIALGVRADQIDDEAVHRAARIANIDGFVTTHLAEGYDTILGERGICLSGGQRQRIGIARALYHDPEILILDEATSALDNQTERAVLEAVEQLSRQKTMIVIAHRLSTVVRCDRICFIEKGEILARGPFDELLETCPAFQAMVRAAQFGGPSTHDSNSADSRVAPRNLTGLVS